jgi:hypothetical protein
LEPELCATWHLPPLSKVAFDSKLHVIRNALGTHTTVSRVQGSKLKTKREIRVASLFKEVPLEWLRMIVVHELAHMKERDHDKSFYALCEHMEPSYHRLEFDVRLYLTHLDSGGGRLWANPLPIQSACGVSGSSARRRASLFASGCQRPALAVAPKSSSSSSSGRPSPMLWLHSIARSQPASSAANAASAKLSSSPPM